MNDKNRAMFFSEDEEEVAVITMTDEDGNEADAILIATFEVEELGNEYVVVLPMEQDEEDIENGESQVFLLRYVENAAGEPDFEPIEDEEEMDIVTEHFTELVDTGVLEMEMDFDEDEE